MENWIYQILPIIEEYKDGDSEPLDGDDVDDLCKIIKAKINLQEGNLTEQEYNEALDVPSGTTLMSMDDLNDISLNMVAEMVDENWVKDCTDTDNIDEFEVQDIINRGLAKFFGLDYEKLQE